MEIVYDESGTRVLLRKDDGSEVDLLKLEGALTLAQTSREFNRKRVVVLESKLERVAAILAEGKEDEFLSVPEIEERLVAGERLYTAAEVGDLQASEAELVAAPLRRRVGDLENELEKTQDALIAARRQREEFDRDRHTERDRADQNKAWAERAEENGAKLSAALVQAEKERDAARRRVADLERQLGRSIERENKLEADAAEEREIHRRSLAARDSLLEAATRRISAARDLLTGGNVPAIRDEIVTSKGAVLADAIGNALRVLDA